MSAQSDMADALFNDSNFATTGTYTALNGSPVSVRVLKAPPGVMDLPVQQGRAGSLPTVKPRLLQSEVEAKPLKGATLTYGGKTYVIEGARAAMSECAWQLDVREQV